MKIDRITIDGLTDEQQEALDDCIGQWRKLRKRNNLRTAFYDMENATDALMDRNIPAVIRRRKFVLGWSALAVDKLNRRCNVDDFYDAGGRSLDDFGMAEIVRENRLAAELSQAGVSSLIHGPSFIVTTQGIGDDEPDVLMLAKDASLATGIWDRRRRAFKSFLSIHDLDDAGEPIDMSLYLHNLTLNLAKDQGRWRIDPRDHKYGVPVDPLRYKARIGRPFGSSRISRAVMSLHIGALGAMIRADVNGEAYSLPRYALLGATEEAFKNADGSPKPVWQAAWDAIWAIGDDLDVGRDGMTSLARADIKQFHGQSPEPQNAHLRMLAQLFSGETSIPVGELGITGDSNPTSAEALLASRDDLIAEAGQTCDEWTPDISSALRRALAMKNGGNLPPDLDPRPQWRSPMHVSRAQAADAGSKTIDKAPWLADTEVGLELMGLTKDQIRRAQGERRRAQGRSLLTQLAERGTGANLAE